MAPTDPYGQQLPTEAQAIAALAEQIGDGMAEGLWTLSTRTLGLERPVSAAADLRRVAEHLMTVGEFARVTARSLKVRAVTYDALARMVP